MTLPTRNDSVCWMTEGSLAKAAEASSMVYANLLFLIKDLMPVLDIVRKLAESDPENETNGCHHCDQPIDEHAPDCLWLQAKKLVES